LPIIEFAVQGHVDVITLTFSILALLSFSDNSIGGRMLTGFLVGMAALTKIYPILLLVVIVPDMMRDAAERTRMAERNVATESNMEAEGNMATARVATTIYEGGPFRRMVVATLAVAMPVRHAAMLARHIKGRDYALLAVCFLTILLGYLPYYIMGHGQVLGYFTIYSSEQGENAGFIQLVMQWIGSANKWSLQTAVAREHLVSLLFIVAVSLVVFVLRLRQRMGMPMAALLLFGAILAISPHVFPWYTTVLLVWIPLLIGPLWTRRRLIGKSPAVGVVWYFICLSLLQYYYISTPHHGIPDWTWTLYYQVAYLPIVIVLAIAAIVGVIHMPGIQKGKQYANRQ